MTLEDIIVLGRMGYSKEDIVRLQPQPQTQSQTQPQP